MIQEGSDSKRKRSLSPRPLAGEAARSAGEGRSEWGAALRMPSPQPFPASGRGGTASLIELRPTLALALLAGVLAVHACVALPPRWFDLAVAIAAVVAFRLPNLRLVAIVALGFAWCAWRADVALDARLPAALEGRDLDIVGVVEGLPDTGRDAARATLAIERASLDGNDVALDGRIRLSWYDAPDTALAPCSRWLLHVRVKRPRGLVNPGGYDAERSALGRGIVAT